MTPAQWFAEHQGTAILVPGGGSGNNGQCEQAIDSFHHEVNGLPYVYTPAAKDWWYDFNQLGLSQWYTQVVNGQFEVGDIILYNPLSASDPQGHGDVCSRAGSVHDFWAYDSNWDATHFHDIHGYPTLHEVHHNDQFNQYVLGSLRFKGGTMTPTAAQVVVAYCLAFDCNENQVPQSFISAYTKPGATIDGMLTQLHTDPTWLAHKAAINAPQDFTPYNGPGLFVQA